MADTANAVEKLAAQARIAQLAAQLRLRLSYARYKTVNKVTKVPFATLERRLEESTPKQSAYALLMLDGLPVENSRNGTNSGVNLDDKSIADALRMPPPPSQSLYTTLLQDIDPRPAKRSKTISQSSHAGAPDPNGFARFQPSASSQPSPHSSQSPGKRLYSSTQKKSAAKEASAKKKKSSSSLPMADREQLAAKTLASLLVANGSPRSPVKSKPAAAKRLKAARPHRSSVSSLDASMADATLAISLGGDTDDAMSRRGSTAGLVDRSNGNRNGGGMDTAPSSPILSAAQRERDSAELLLLLATSPSPARTTRDSAIRPSNAIGQTAGRVLFPETSSSSSTTAPTGGRGTGSTSNIPSLLLPAAPSPTKKSNSSGKTKSGREERFTVPAHPSLGVSFNPLASSALQPPFTPGTSTFPGGPSTFPSSSIPFGTGFTLGSGTFAPSTPSPLPGFNMADYINFTPTPGGFSPAQNPKSRESGIAVSSTSGQGAPSNGSGFPGLVHQEGKPEASIPRKNSEGPVTEQSNNGYNSTRDIKHRDSNDDLSRSLGKHETEVKREKMESG